MRKIKIVAIFSALLILFIAFVGCAKSTDTKGSNYTIPMLDLSKDKNVYDAKYNELFEQYVVDNASDYMAHPDSILLKDGRIMTMYPEGHGKGPVLTKISADGGKTWSDRLTTTPDSWKDSKETPTVYRLNFSDGSDKIVMISANPDWWDVPGPGDGFNASFSNDDGATWSEFKKFYGKGSSKFVEPIVAMSALTRLKDRDGNWRDAWMGIFHDNKFVNYKTILTFENGEMVWSEPTPYFSEYRKLEKNSAMCEVEMIRSDNGNGNQLCIITRSNGRSGNKYNNSLISFSNDEGETWSEPKEAPAALSGERHKAEWLPDGRLFITFRSIERDPEKLKLYNEGNGKNWYSEGWIAWVGTYNDLVNGNEGEYRIKLAHTYFAKQTESVPTANGDTGYCGNVILPDGTIYTSTYGTFDLNSKTADGELKTFIVGKRIDIKLCDELVQIIKLKS